jgi:hypothetical protein
VLRYRRAKQLEPEPPADRPFRADEWRLATGDMRLLGQWLATLRRELAEAPWTAVLARWWPRLLPGLAASATHGVIRTAHAVRSLAAARPDPDPLLVDELAQGLAFWGARYQLLPGAPGLAGTRPAGAALARLPRVGADEPVTGPGISGDLGRLTRLAGFGAALDRYRAPADPHQALDELVATAARVLWTHPDRPIGFCHAVTAPAALRLVLPHLPAPLHRATIAAAWQVIGGIVAALSPDPAADGLDSPLPDPALAPSPGALFGRAVEHGDEHVIKLTEAAIREHARTRDPVLLHAAHAFVDRLDPLAG